MTRASSYELFREEAVDLLQRIEQSLLVLANSPSRATIHDLMRSTHTLKGAAANVGCDGVKSLSHELEDIFRALLAPEATVEPEVEQLLVESYECLRLAVNAQLNGQGDDGILNRARPIFDQLRELLQEYIDAAPALPSAEELGFDLTRSIFEVGVSERLEQMSALLADESQTDDALATAMRSHLEVFVGLGESLELPGFQAIAHTTLQALERHPEAVRPISVASFENLQASQEAVLAGDRSSGGEVSPTLAGWVEDESPFAIAPGAEVAAEKPQATAPPRERESRDNFAIAPVSEVETQELSPRALKGEITAPHTTADGEAAPPNQNSPSQKRAPSPIRVEVSQLEGLAHLVGELLINQNQSGLQDRQLQLAVSKLSEWLERHERTLSQLQADLPPQSPVTGTIAKGLSGAREETAQLAQAADDLQLLCRSRVTTRERQQRAVKQVQEQVEDIRLLELERLLARFSPMVERLSVSYRKSVALDVESTTVTVDKAIAEPLYEVLLHLVRNAFDHGIESSQMRQERGKPPQGQITIRAYSQGNRTFIEVSDDGGGLDREKICRRAYEQKLISRNEMEAWLNSPQIDSRLLQLMSQPGFSTRSRADDLSGRGVGLDVVSLRLRELGGTLSVSSTPGEGTTFRIQIRGTLMNAKLLVARAGQSIYTLISDEIEQVLLPSPDRFRWLSGQKVLDWHPQDAPQETISLPVYDLAEAIAYRSPLVPTPTANPLANASTSLLVADEHTQPILLLETPHGKVGLAVDAAVEERELAIRPLSEAIAAPPYVYGCTVLADGSLALVLDGSTLIENVARVGEVNRRRPQASSPATATPEQVNPLQLDATNPYGEYGWARLPQGESKPESASQAEPMSPQPPGGLRTLLIVDDSMTERQTLTEILQKAGHQVVQARDGQEALERLQQGAEVDLVICDLEMPRVNGLEFLNLKRQETANPDIPVVILTSRAPERYQSIALELGAKSYLTKPYLDQELLSAISECLPKS